VEWGRSQCEHVHCWKGGGAMLPAAHPVRRSEAAADLHVALFYAEEPPADTAPCLHGGVQRVTLLDAQW